MTLKEGEGESVLGHFRFSFVLSVKHLVMFYAILLWPLMMSDNLSYL